MIKTEKNVDEAELDLANEIATKNGVAGKVNVGSDVTLKESKFSSFYVSNPEKKVLSFEKLFEGSENDEYYGLLRYLYVKNKELYRKIGARKNGEDSFLHPMNVVLTLKNNGAKNFITLCAGFLHDYIEEHVDLYKKEKNVDVNTKEGKLFLDAYEMRLHKEFRLELKNFCEKKKLSVVIPLKMAKVVALLTRHKRHFYYKSLSYLFRCKNLEIREAAIQVKLADRIHNIQSLEAFDSEGKLYQCFKNFFILNNAKQFLLEIYGQEVFFYAKRKASGEDLVLNLTERLFNNCAKASYGAYLKIFKKAAKEIDVSKVEVLLQLAFKKYMFEHSGLWLITDVDLGADHPMKLYDGLIRKFDARLHNEADEYKNRRKMEMDFCKQLFGEFSFSKEKLQAILDYKDAYAMKEAISYLIYKSDYVLRPFLVSELTSGGRIRKGRRKYLI